MAELDFPSVSTLAHWAWPYIATGFASLVGFAGILKTSWGTGLFSTGIKHHFDKKIDDLRHEKNRELGTIKHAYDREIEGLKSELSQATDRGIRSNELEYQALIKTWERFIEAYHATHGAVGGFRGIPNLQSMSEAELDEWLALSELSASDKRFIKNAPNKTSALSRIGRNDDLNEANKSIWEAQVNLRRQSVFLPESIEDDFDKALAKLREVWAENHVNFDTPGSLPLKATLTFLEENEVLKNSLRDKVRERVLHSPRLIKGQVEVQH